MTVFSQTSEKKTQQIISLMEKIGTKKILEQMTISMKENYQKNFPDTPTEFWDNFFKEMKGDDLINLIVPIYDKHFTEEDINALVAFYDTPVGKKMVEKLPLIMQESITVGQKWGKEIAEKVIQKMNEKEKQNN